MQWKRPVMLKPDDPAWADLVTTIESVVSHRFVEDPDAFCRPFYMPSKEEPGFIFGSLNREDQMDLLAELVSWRHYEGQGVSLAQQRIVIGNVLEGKPQEKWLEGVFDEAVLENDRIASFKASVEDMKNSPDNHVFEEMDGDRLPWDDLSAAAKLQYIAWDAAHSDVPFEPFAQVVKDTIGNVGEAALRVVLDGQKELHAIAKLFPDDGRTEPTPLVDQVKEMLDYVKALETQQEEQRQGTEELREGINNVLDGKPSEHWIGQPEQLTKRGEAMSNGQQQLKKLTMTELAEASQRLPKENTRSRVADRGKDRDIER